MQAAASAQTYKIIREKAESNTTAQALSGIFGWPITIATDIAVIPLIYVPLWDRIRDIYGRGNINQDVAGKIIAGIVSEIFVDIAFDKFLGNVPLIGIYFNAICAKTMTWRLGTLFAMLSARGEEVESLAVRDAMVLIRKVFPQGDMFKFKTPDKAVFCKLVDGVTDIEPEDFNRKVMGLLEGLES